MPPDETEQVFTEHFEDHADVRTIGTAMAKMVEKANDMPTSCVVGIRGDYTLQKLYFIEGGLSITGSGFDDFQGDMAIKSLGIKATSVRGEEERLVP